MKDIEVGTPKLGLIWEGLTLLVCCARPTPYRNLCWIRITRISPIYPWFKTFGEFVDPETWSGEIETVNEQNSIQ